MEKILKVIEESVEFNDSIYNDLVVKYGKDIVDEVIMKILHNKDINPKAYKKLVEYSGKTCYKVANGIYINVLNEIIKELNEIFISIGCGNDYKFLGKMMYLKVDEAISKCDDKETIINIKSLYKEFILIRDKIFNSNLGLVDRLMKKFCIVSDKEGLYQEATIGLLRSCEKYDNTRGAFSTFANANIYYTILRHLCDDKKYFYMRNDISFEYDYVARAIKEYYDEYGYYPTDVELAYKTQLPLESIKLYKIVYNYDNRDITIDSNVLVDDEYISVIDSFYDERLDNNSVENTIFEKELSSIFNELVESLPDNYKNVIRGIYYENRSLSSIGKEMNVTLSRVGAIRHEALAKIRRNRRKLESYY